MLDEIALLRCVHIDVATTVSDPHRPRGGVVFWWGAPARPLPIDYMRLGHSPTWIGQAGPILTSIDKCLRHHMVVRQMAQPTSYITTTEEII